MNSNNIYNLKSWIKLASNKLDLANNKYNLNIVDSKIDAEVLLLFVLNKPKTFLYTDSEYILDNKEYNKLNILLERRLKGEPIAYIIGHKEFWSLDFKVTPDVLIPRPDTEILVEKVLENLPQDKNCNIADIGTGSGAIAIALAKERPNWQIHAVDISKKALDIAKENAELNNINNIKFYIADLFSSFDDLDIKFDLIVSNPPYIDEADEYIKNINTVELQHEPKMALIAEDSGLKIIKKLIKNAPNYLNISGQLFIEHGYDQKNYIKKYINDYKIKHKQLKFIQDLNKLDRVVYIKF